MKTDAFISHASANLEFAEVIGRALKAGKLKTWVDRSDVQFGSLLRNQIRSAIYDSRVLVLLWSEAAFKSRWVMAEIFMALYLERFIIPCVLDTTPLPQFLANAAYLDHQRDKDRIGEELCRAVRAAPAGANEVAAVMVSETLVVQSLINAVSAGQYGVMRAVVSDVEQAAKANRDVSDALRSLQQMAPLHPMVLNLAGYQCKNDYTIKHWDAIQAGRAPKDQLLDRGERHFFESLCVNPYDESAINGLGNILFFERELDAAEYFHRRAIDLYFRRTGKSYEAAQHDLDMVLEFKRQPAQAVRK
jgi:TIR domain-containing protein